MCKCYHLTQEPVRALGWKASAVLASLISHPSLILSVTQSAWLQCSSGLLLHRLGCGLWAQRSCECSDGWSCRYYSPGMGWSRSLCVELAWGLQLQMKQHEKLQSAGNPWAQHMMLMWPLTEQRMGAPSVLARACPLEQKQVISKDVSACFCLNILTSFVKTCAVGGLHILETMSAATQIGPFPEDNRK